MILQIKNKFCDRSIELPGSGDITVDGFRDSHGHIMWLGMSLASPKIEGLASISDTIEQIKNWEYKSEWILARGWNEELWESEIPTKGVLDNAFPNNPVMLTRIDGHASWCNSLALKKSGINKNTPNPDGGEIKKDANGEPNGILIDMAIELVNAKLPKYTNEDYISFINKACLALASKGITEASDMDVHTEWLPAFEQLAKSNELPIKIKSNIRGFDGEWERLGLTPKVIGNLNLSGVKFFADGALGSRGAALIDDYSDDPGNKGLFLISEEELYTKAKKACEAGWEIATHAIGDAANRMVLDVYEKLRNDGFKNILRIEHAQIVHPDDLQRFSDLEVEAHIQPMFAVSDKEMAESRLGNRISYAYPWKSLLDLRIKVYGGSDFPIESFDPLLGIKALVNPQIEWQKDQIFSIEEALKIYI